MSLDPVEILLVEDNPYDAEMTIRSLQGRHLANRLHHVKDGAEALAFIFARGPYSHRTVEAGPHLILLDLKLPKVDGLEVIKTIKADERTRPIPVVVLTSSTEEPDIAQSYRLGVNSYIVKPVDFEKFSDVISQLGLYWILLNRRCK